MRKYMVMFSLSCVLLFSATKEQESVDCISLWIDMKLLASPKTHIDIYYCNTKNGLQMCNDVSCNESQLAASLDEKEQIDRNPCLDEPKRLTIHTAIQLYEKHCK